MRDRGRAVEASEEKAYAFSTPYKNLLLKEGCPPLDRLLQVHHCGQSLVLDIDHVQGILREPTTGGQHRRHGLSRILRDRSRHGPSALGVHAFPDASEAKLPLTM